MHLLKPPVRKGLASRHRMVEPCVPNRQLGGSTGIRLQSRSWPHKIVRCQAEIQASSVVVTECNEHAETERFQFLEKQAVGALQACVDEFAHPVFPCALIAGDVVILHLLHKHGLIDQVKVAYIDTLHLFEETGEFLEEVEERYQFKALRYLPKDFANYEEYKAVHGVDLPIRDIEEYDRICKVEPFQRALSELQCDMMINGRRRDHGADRAHLQLFSVARNGVANCQPLAYWSFEDCFTFAAKEGFNLHPLHEKGYPSVGDVHSTLPVDRSKWFEYGMERSGRFTGLQNEDGSTKTECGIHTVSVDGPASSVNPASQTGGASSSINPAGAASSIKPSA